MATKLDKKWQAIGMTPIKDEQAYRETVQNLVRQHQEALDVAETATDEAQAEEAKQRVITLDEKLQKVPDSDVTAAMTAIEEAASYPQVIAAVGEEVREEGT